MVTTIWLCSAQRKATNINLDDDVKYLEVNTEDVKGIGNEANLEKAS